MSETIPLPRVQPSELLARFQARGVVIREAEGMLHVEQPERLTKADLVVLSENSAGIVAALARRAAVI